MRVQRIRSRASCSSCAPLTSSGAPPVVATRRHPSALASRWSPTPPPSPILRRPQRHVPTVPRAGWPPQRRQLCHATWRARSHQRDNQKPHRCRGGRGEVVRPRRARGEQGKWSSHIQRRPSGVHQGQLSLTASPCGHLRAR
jgi:hypothetical protein